MERSERMRLFHRLKRLITFHADKQTSSHRPLLIKTLTEKQPKRILEWGSGRSSILMEEIIPDVEIHSIEHNWKWFLRIKFELWKIGSKIHLHRIPLNNGYTTPDFPEKYFDFVFIDGKRRPECMIMALTLMKDDGLLLLHNSHEEWFHKIHSWRSLFNIVEEIGKPGDKTTLMRKKK